MEALNAFTLLINGVTLALAIGFLIIILWSDWRKELNQFFAMFLFLVALWNVGALVAQSIALVGGNAPLATIAIGVMELGFTGSSVAVYALTAVVVRAHTRRFRLLTFATLLLVIGYRTFLISSGAPSSFVTGEEGAFSYRAQPLFTVFYVVFDGAALLLLWRYWRRIRTRALAVGLLIFIVGQTIGFLNPALAILSLSINVSAVAALVIGFALVRQEIIAPLAERNSQVEAMRRVSLAIARQMALDTMLDQIARQAAVLLGADAVGIFLNDGDDLQLATSHQLPAHALHLRTPIGSGIAGTAARKRESILIEDYRQDWKGESELPMAHETFGSVIGAPMIYGGDAIGALTVINGRQGRVFRREDVYLLESLGVQAAIAIAHNRLFAEQGELTRQLETVLVSTESPVIAVDRGLRMVFANPAGKALFSPPPQVGAPLPLLEGLLPDVRVALREMRRGRAYTYEVALNDRVYLAHLAPLGERRPEGFVCVLNDVSQLKELDRMKSEMVRMTSHDLKNPLQAVKMHAELLQLDADQLPQELHSSIDVILDSVRRMERIIRGILDMERWRAGASVVEPCAPARLVREAAAEMRYHADQRRIALSADAPDDLPLVACDLEQFHRALVNLIENAIKFTPDGGRVSIAARRDEGGVAFVITDTGVGIPEDDQSHVFERFYRARHKATEHVTGTGLGLSLVRSVVDNHGGRVSLHSREGEGTIVTIVLPVLSSLPRPQKRSLF